MGVGFEPRGAVLVVIRDESPSPTEYEDFLYEMQALDAAGVACKVQPVCILVTSPKTPAPDAYWRKRYAELARASKCDVHFALVTESAIQRGVLTAIRWLLGNAKGVAEAHASFDAACAGARKATGRSLPELSSLLLRAERHLRTGALDQAVSF